MLSAVIIFVLGSSLYKHRTSEGTGGLERLWAMLRRRHDPLLENEEGSVVKMIPIFVPIMAFWALYDQQGSRWTFQAMLMDPRVWGLTIKPEQMQVINAVLILILIPVFDRILYPAVAHVRGKPLKPLQKMTMGMMLAIVSFVMAAILQEVINVRSQFMADPVNPGNLICVAGCVPILWQSWQYLLITSAEIMVSITGLEFAYSQAPASMKSVCQSLWLLTVAGGNLLVILINVVDPLRFINVSHTTGNFVLWAGILAMATLFFQRQAKDYVYREEMHTITLDQ